MSSQIWLANNLKKMFIPVINFLYNQFMKTEFENESEDYFESIDLKELLKVHGGIDGEYEEDCIILGCLSTSCANDCKTLQCLVSS